MDAQLEQIIKLILVFVFPPAAVMLHDGEFSRAVLIDLCLCFLFVWPGILYALLYCFMNGTRQQPLVVVQQAPQMPLHQEPVDGENT